ncbi:major facilitator superfamily domain-containing protein [Parasitella parasitica]|nr:major facilitator superfamily domain-containing protein [Parasitella parasitica]
MIPRPSYRFSLALSFLAALIVANVSGPQYIYPTFGTSLTERFNWSPVQNSFVSTACFVGVSFSGPLCSWMIETLKIRKTLQVSALLMFLGPFLVAQTYAGRLPDSFILCAFYLITSGIAGAAAYLCALDSQSHNFKQRRGLSMGLTTASVGTCGVVFSQINDLLFGSERYEKDVPTSNDSTYNFLIFLAFTMSAGILFGSFFLGPLQEHSHRQVIYEQIDEEQQQAAFVNTRDSSVSDTDSVESSPLLTSSDLDKLEGDCASETVISGINVLKHPIGFALFSTLFVVLGIGYIYLANIGQILSAISGAAAGGEANQHTRNLHITLFSLGNCGSRAFFGALSDVLRNKFGIHRLWIFAFALVSMLMTLTWLVSASVMTLEKLIPCTLVISSAYGIAFGVGPAVTTEFGTEVFARNWGIFLFAPAFGSQIFNILFGVLYGHQAEKQNSHVCYGAVCYKSTFRIGIICAIAALAVLSFAIYKAGLYRRRIPSEKVV